MFYTAAIAAAKFSVLLLYRRAFPNPRFRLLLWIVGGFILCYSIAQAGALIFQCSPIAGAWDPSVHVKASCIEIHVVVMTISCVNVVTDIVTL